MSLSRMIFSFLSVDFLQDYVISTVKRAAGLYFVHCIKPLFHGSQKFHTEELLDIGLVRKQLRCLSIVETTHAAKKGVLFLLHTDNGIVFCLQFSYNEAR